MPHLYIEYNDDYREELLWKLSNIVYVLSIIKCKYINYHDYHHLHHKHCVQGSSIT